MILVRGVFQAKYGRGSELVALLKEGQELWGGGHPSWILTDLSGPFFTVVSESMYPDFAAWQKEAQEIFERPDFSDWFARMTELVESGRREFYTVEYSA